MQSKIIMVASGKGGTGKSTLSVLVGAQLAKLKKRVLLVELDSGLRSVDIISGVYGKTVYDINDVLSGRCEPSKAVVQSPLNENLFIVSAPYAGGIVETTMLINFLRTVYNIFDFIILDTAAGMGAPFEAARACSHMALIVATPDPVSIRDGRIVVDSLYEINRPMEIRLLLNKVPTTLENSGLDTLDECIDTVGAQLIGVIPYSTKIIKTSAAGEEIPTGSKEEKALYSVACRICGVDMPLVVH